VKGKFLAIVGHYLPARDPAVFQHDDATIRQWVSKGAVPSDTVARLLKRAGMTDMDKFIVRYAKQKSKKEQAAEPAPAAPAAAAPAAAEAAPAAEAKAEEPKAEEAKPEEQKA
jgi:small subunit ribosomal protein S16